jgi:hypothetical protein
MFFTFGTKKKRRAVAGGQRLQQQCPSCSRQALIIECEVTDTLDVYFVDVLDDTKRVLVCTECDAEFDVPRAQLDEKPAPRRLPAPQPRLRSDSPEIAARLAALKKKMT